ncbi:MAG: FecR domain-containing protein [Terriglobales bacterium]
MRGLRLALSVVAVLAVASLVARADSSVRIVRLSLVVGAVEVNLPDGHGWRPAMLNLPLVEGEQVRTLDSGRAEIQFEGGSTLRLIPDSTVTLTRLRSADNGEFRTTAALAAGSAFVTLRKSDARDFVLQLPGGQLLRPDGAVAWRASGDGAVQVFDGKLRQQSPGGGEESLRAADHPPAADPWTQWSQDRDQFYAKAFHAGAQQDDAVTLVNWWSQMDQPMPRYSGTGLAYTGEAACPWTQTSGDYKGWCWTQSGGWFLPAAPPAVKVAAARSASDIHQTNGVLADSLPRANPLMTQVAFSYCMNAAFTQYGWNVCNPLGTMIDPALLSFSQSLNYGGGYVPLVTADTLTTARVAHHGPHPSRRIAEAHRLGPPPPPRFSSAAYTPAFHSAHLSGGAGAAPAHSLAAPAAPAVAASPGAAAHASVAATVHATAPRTVH